MDALEHSRRLKCLTIVDDFTKEAIDIVVDHGISGAPGMHPLVLR
jgi:putative transposase